MPASTTVRPLAIAIPFYRGIEYLRRAIQSVLEQTDPHWQLTVSDDGGTDPGAEALVESYNDQRIQYSLSQARLGMVGNWNRCLALARTHSPQALAITLLHADDELMPEYVSTLRQGWTAFPDAAALYCRPMVIDEKGSAVFSFPDFYKRLLVPRSNAPTVLKGESGLHALIRGNFIFCPTLCYRASLPGLEFQGRWKMVQDLECTTSLLFRGETIVGLPQVAYRYRRHADNATNAYTHSLVRFEEEFALLAEIATRATQKNWLKAAASARRATVVRLHLGYRILQDGCGLNFTAAIKKARFLLKKAG